MIPAATKEMKVQADVGFENGVIVIGDGAAPFPLLIWVEGYSKRYQKVGQHSEKSGTVVVMILDELIETNHAEGTPFADNSQRNRLSAHSGALNNCERIRCHWIRIGVQVGSVICP
jgi:hypothetical protein